MNQNIVRLFAGSLSLSFALAGKIGLHFPASEHFSLGDPAAHSTRQVHFRLDPFNVAFAYYNSPLLARNPELVCVGISLGKSETGTGIFNPQFSC